MSDTLHVITGRGGNVWTSPPGCLMFSLTKQLDVGGARLPFVQYIACMAVVEAVQQLLSGRVRVWYFHSVP